MVRKQRGLTVSCRAVSDMMVSARMVSAFTIMSFVVMTFVGAGVSATVSLAETPRLELRPDDHVCILGGGVADAMQHSGWLEVVLHARFPGHRLVIRNLGFDGDEIDPARRLRSADFGSPDQWLAGEAPVPRPEELGDRAAVRHNRFELTGTRADVILAFFGSNEAHAGPAGLAAFREQATTFIRHTLTQHYNGTSPPRLVMLSPIAHENLQRRHWPDGTDHNANLALYSRALEEVCRAEGVVFVDLFGPTRDAQAAAIASGSGPLTDDGIHPNARGDRVIAGIVDAALFGPPPQRPERSLARLQAAVADKNFHWFHRYRVTDGYSTYGGRAWLKFVDGQSNYEVGQRELEYLDVKTANRDRRIWATAATIDDPDAPLPPVDDGGLPELLEVVTNKPGPLPDGGHDFLSGEGAIERMTVHEGMRVELFADEAMVPELINPVQMAFDTRGRLWVATWPTYPHWRPDRAMNDSLLILEDTDGDGRADRVTTFAGDLHNPTGFEFWGGGVIVAQGPELLFLEDTDGDDVADIKRRILFGLDTADTHHTANSFALDPSGTLYFQEGTFHHSQPESPWGPPVRVANGAVFRYEPRTGKVGLYTSYAFANPHGHVFDRWGDDIVVDGTGAVPYWGSVFSTRLDGMDKHSGAPSVYQPRTRPCPAIEILSSPHFPDAFQGNLLVGNVIGFQGILRYDFRKSDDPAAAFPEVVEVEPIVSSTDPNFRPADIEMGPDGAIWFVDWHNPIIGHMQHNLRDPGRDARHGRVYRVVMDGRPPAPPVAIMGRPVAELVGLLTHPTDRVRARVRIELSGRPESDVVPAVRAWLAALDPAAASFERDRLEGLWMLRQFDQVDQPLLEAVLSSSDPRARAAGLRVLAAVADRVADPLAAVLHGAADSDPRVRLEAVRTASFLRVPEAVEALAIAAELPADRFMNYVSSEAARVLVSEFEAARAAGREMAFRTDAGHRFLYRGLSTEQLTALPPEPAVLRELLLRDGLDERQRTTTVERLAEAEGTTPVRVTAAALATLDRQEGPIESAIVFELIRVLLSRPTSELASLRDEMERLAIDGRRPEMRRIGYVALMTVDAASGGGAVDRAWALAAARPGGLVDLVEALPLVSDPAAGAALYDRVAASLGEPLASTDDASTDDAATGPLRRAALAALAGVRGREADAFSRLSRFIRDDIERDAAIRAAARIPVTFWSSGDPPALVAALVASLRAASAEERADDAGLAAWQFAEQLTTVLPPEEGRPWREELAELGVRVVRIGTVYERMAYDVETVVVQAGRPVLFVLENVDAMPHNFVITRPGRMQKVGETAEARAQSPGFARRHFVPKSPDVLAASTLMQPQTTQRLTFTPPTEPCVLPFVCTYPGHWRRMFGALYVVEDLEAYLADPEAYLAAHPLPIRDPLLRDRRPRTRWTLEDLEGDILAMEKGRSFAHGRELFRTASCVACHRLGGEGIDFGPELAKLSADMTPVEITRHILEPSLRIEDRYRSTTVVTESGRAWTGLVVEETPGELALVENPVVQTEPVRIPIASIEERAVSPVSLMPKGLLDPLTRDEILDLVAYVSARGEQGHVLFSPDGCSHDGHPHSAP
jgi:putative heme-binding domain-containing protein